MKKVYLRPEQWLVTSAPTEVATVLGSCVSVTLFHPPSRLAGICHAVLPGTGEGGSEGRYVLSVLARMVEVFRRAGVRSRDIEAKLFGGAASLAGDSSASVGAQNVREAMDFLQEARIPVRASNTGGRVGRKILFYTTTGVVMHKYLT